MIRLTLGIAAYLSIVPASGPPGPTRTGPLQPGPAAAELSLRAYDVAVAGDRLLAATTAGLTVYDISEPGHPTRAAVLHFPGSANAVAVDGDLAFLSLGPEGLRILDISNPDRPRLAGALDTNGSVNAALPAGPGRLVIADGALGLKTIDISDPAVPKVIAELDTGAYAKHLDVAGELAAVAQDDAGVMLVRIGADGALVPLSTVETPGLARGVALDGGRCYVASGPEGLTVLGVSNPVSPRITGRAPSAGYARGVSVDGRRVLLSDGDAGLRVFAAGGEPSLLGEVRTARPANRARARRAVVFLAEDSAGVRAVDLSDPKAPRLLGADTD